MLFPTIMSQYSGELTWTNTPKLATSAPQLLHCLRFCFHLSRGSWSKDFQSTLRLNQLRSYAWWQGCCGASLRRRQFSQSRIDIFPSFQTETMMKPLSLSSSKPLRPFFSLTVALFILLTAGISSPCLKTFGYGSKLGNHFWDPRFVVESCSTAFSLKFSRSPMSTIWNHTSHSCFLAACHLYHYYFSTTTNLVLRTNLTNNWAASVRFKSGRIDGTPQKPDLFHNVYNNLFFPFCWPFAKRP